MARVAYVLLILMQLGVATILTRRIVSAANSIAPSPPPSHTFPVGHPEILDGEPVSNIRYNKSKEERTLGIKFHTKVESTKDTLDDFA